MGYCKFCNTYYKKNVSGEICRRCSQELSCTPPSINNTMKQLEIIMSKKKLELEHETNFKKTATLMDLTANEILLNPELIINLTSILPDGNMPWYALLRAWYRKNKKRGRHLNLEQTPKDRLLKLMGISQLEYKIIDNEERSNDIPDFLDDTYLNCNIETEALEEIEKIEDLDEWYFQIDI